MTFISFGLDGTITKTSSPRIKGDFLLQKTYVSLFSSAGVGDYGFYMSGFNLVASNELLSRRMMVQRANHIAKRDSAYITGDIERKNTKKQIVNEINKWISNESESLDLLVATPPCQGISVANHYRSSKDLHRNSLVLQSILVAEMVKPKVIVFENVKRFMKTACTDVDGETYEISTVISNHLSGDYVQYAEEVNFKDYGANSSRPRTLVILARKDYFGREFDPKSLMPSKEKEKTLREVIGDLPSLKQMGEICPNDILHEFRPYRKDMRSWISGLEEGQSAFDNVDPAKRPHRVINNKIVPNVNKNSDKYKRQSWNKVAPAVHTRNDILASQNTVHPADDRVFSIRELMRMMNVPKDFQWSRTSYDDLNKLPPDEKAIWLKKHEMVIRQSLGEAVPTVIFYKIGQKIMETMIKIDSSKQNKKHNRGQKPKRNRQSA